MNYWIYENHVHDFARVHRAECRFCCDGAGLHRKGTVAVAGRWLGPFATVTQAVAEADRLGRETSRCSVCEP